MGFLKSAGPDGLKPIVMKHFGPVAISCITKLFQAIYSTGHIPRQWRKSRVVFIPKPLKNYYGDVGSFSPISLTQFVFKTMDKIVEWSLREHAHNFGTISPMQPGCAPANSHLLTSHSKCFTSLIPHPSQVLPSHVCDGKLANLPSPCG